VDYADNHINEQDYDLSKATLERLSQTVDTRHRKKRRVFFQNFRFPGMTVSEYTEAFAMMTFDFKITI